MWEIDGRTEDDILEQFGGRAASYVPEWKFDREHPDAGTALAFCYARMMSGTIKRLNQALLKHRVAFLNGLGAGRFPAEPARGYVAFSLVNSQAEGTQAPAGTVVNAHGEEDGALLSYKTLEDVYVTAARVADVIEADSKKDYIGCLYGTGAGRGPDSGPAENSGENGGENGGENSGENGGENTAGDEMQFGGTVVWPAGQTVFGRAAANLQRHELYLCCGEELLIKGAATIELEFLQKGGRSIPEEIAGRLLDPSVTRFEYSFKEGRAGFTSFERQEREGGVLRFLKGRNQPAPVRREWEGGEGYLIRCTSLWAAALAGFSFETARIGTAEKEIAPDSIYAGGIECGGGSIYPFGERPTVFSEIYFGSEEALGKKGAQAELRFYLDYVKIPLEPGTESDPVQWNWVMKKEDFEKDPEYDITVDTVLWEYYNGLGWARLFPDGDYEQLFRPCQENKNRICHLSFLCPPDMEPLTVNSCRSCYIRARVLKMGNFYKMKGAFITPVIREPLFSFDYRQQKKAAACLFIRGNLSQEKKRNCLGERITPFEGAGETGKTLYLGFDQPFYQEPIKLFFQVSGRADRSEAAFRWEYCGEHGWKEADLVDGTENLSCSGIVTLMGGGKFCERKLFGRKRFWLRIRDAGGYFGRPGSAPPPVLLGICMNVSSIVHADKEALEYFRMEGQQENRVFRLSERGLTEAAVFVKESGSFSDVWERWECGGSFDRVGPQSRFCVLDKTEGTLRFGDGRRGRIPPVSREDNIRVEYCLGGGAAGNVKKGAVNQLAREIGFISGVFNPEALTGGCGVEEMGDAVLRSSAAVRHQNRAVTVGDYEDIACHSSRSVRRARCFSGFDEKGQRRPGAVTLVLLQEEFDRAPSRFMLVKQEVWNCLEDKTGEHILLDKNLFIRQPEFIHLCVRAEVSTADSGGVFLIRKAVKERLDHFLEPLRGNFRQNGWEVGTLPNSVQIKNAIASIPGVSQVKGLSVYGYKEVNGRKKEVDLELAAAGKYVLPLSGEHEIAIAQGRP